MSDEGVRFMAKKHYAVLEALAGWPKMPDPFVLQIFGQAANGSEDKARGSKLQRELGLSVIPPVAECESGAGFWDRVTNGAWRDCLEKQDQQ